MKKVRWVVVLVVASVAGLVFAPMASASSVTSPSASLFVGGGSVTHVAAGTDGGLQVFMTATTALGGGDTVTITGPQGTVFDNALLTQGYPVVNTMKNLTADPGTTQFPTTAGITDSGRTITFVLPGSFSVAAGDQFMVGVSFYQSYVSFGTVAGANSFQLSTNKDTTPVDTPTYQTDPAAPASVVVVDGSQRTPFNQLFDSLNVEVTDQYGNGVSGQNVSATAPSTGPSGTFPAGATSATVTTGADGQATLPRITASSEVGFWQLDLLGPGVITGANEMHNLAYGDAEVVDLSLAPSAVPADGSSTVAATATVSDDFGNLIPGETLVLSSDNGQPVGAVTDNGDGTYTGQVISTTKAGQSTITATDSSPHDPLSGTATLTQTALPAKTITLTLSPSSLPADGKSVTTATAVVKNALGNVASTASVAFKSDGGQSIGAVKNSGQGTFSAPVTASKSAGTSRISATVAGTSPAVTASASLTQTKVPVKVVKPVLKFKKPPKKKVKSAKVKFRFKVVKGKAKGFQCKLDKKKWSKCKSPKKVKLKLGKHVFKVRGIATNGSHGKVVKRKIKRVR